MQNARIQDVQYLLLVGERVESAGGEAGEGIIRGGENGEPSVAFSVLKNLVNLAFHLRAPQQPDQRLKLPGFLQDPRDVQGSRRRRCRCRLSFSSAEDQEEKDDSVLEKPRH